MFTRLTKSATTRTALAAGTLGLAALVAAGTATAGSADDQFLAALKKDGISYADATKMVTIGKNICTSLDSGKSADSIKESLQKANPGLGEKGAKVIIVDAAKSYCPQYLA